MFVDYFPPLDRFEFQAVGKSMVVLGASPLGEVRAGANATIVVGLLQRSDSAARAEVHVELKSAGKATRSKAARVFPGAVHAAGHWSTGEPRRIDFSVPVPQAATGRLAMTLIVGGSKKASRVSLGEIEVGARHDRASATWARFPDDLPPARRPELRARAEAVRQVVDHRFFVAKQDHRDEALGAELVHLGESLEAAGDREQSYLAYVWATQVDRRRARDLHRRLEALRDPKSNVRFVREFTLLRRVYASEDDRWALRLASHYVLDGQPDKARYFIERLREQAEHAERIAALESVMRGESAADSLRSRAFPRPLPGIASDFETEVALGWTLSAAFGGSTHEVDTEQTPSLSGYEGQRVLAAHGRRGKRAAVKAETRPFEVDGSVMSLLFAASPQGVVELVADGKVVRSVRGHRSDEMQPVFWEVDDLIGQEVILRVHQAKLVPKGRVALDHIEMWP
jgi:hypothetical protein